VARRQLFFTSGHEGYYAQNMFDAMELDDAEYRLKPMNCPGHILIYKDSLKSYRDLPVRLGELGTVYRYERSGVMHGLLRVRGFTQDDAHIFCMPEQVEARDCRLPGVCAGCAQDFGFDKFQTELSTWNPNDRKSFVGSEEQWVHATEFARESAAKVEYRVQDDPRRGGVLRAEDRYQAGGCDWTVVAALDGAVRFQPCRSASAWNTWPRMVRASSR
jgi:threonyl-tRNA synthetase